MELYVIAPKLSIKGFVRKRFPFKSKGGSEFGFYDDVAECVEESVEMEARLFDSCMEEDEDQEECEELIDDFREEISEMLTRDGCEDLYGSMQCSYASDKDECEEEVEELCEDLPKSF